jgi:uncharacterized coiled-coil protein SlyX
MEARIKGVPVMPHPRSPVERFWEVVVKTGECWLWTGDMYNDGYGRIRPGLGKKYVRAHRFSWELHHGAIQKGLYILHHCDNPICVRPDHLFVGSKSDNMKDCAAKGRCAAQKRTSCLHGHAFTEENVYLDQRGRRACLTCKIAKSKLAWVKKKAAANALQQRIAELEQTVAFLNHELRERAKDCAEHCEDFTRAQLGLNAAKKRMAELEAAVKEAVETIKKRIAHYTETREVSSFTRGIQINEAEGCLESLAKAQAALRDGGA